MESSGKRIASCLVLVLALALAGCPEDGDGGGKAQGGDGGSGGGDGLLCGNGDVDAGEQCDDGGTAPGDGCSATCRFEGCGDEDVGAGEECDDGNRNDGDGCSATCQLEGCLRDADCSADLGEICVRGEGEVRGVCEASGQECESEANCPSVDPARCPTFDSCTCVPSASSSAGGICRVRVPHCEPCGADVDCGASELYERPAFCAEFLYRGGTEKVCLPKNVAGRQCPGGFVGGTAGEGHEGLCIPANGSCPLPGTCNSNADCPFEQPICNLVTGFCTDQGLCYINQEQGETVGCPPGKPACHALPGRLDPELLGHCESAPAYGYGACGPECTSDDECARRGNDATGKPFVCREDGGSKRCRPEGCVHDMECPEPTGDFLGFCDPTSHACRFDACRLGPDPRAGCGVNQPYVDCMPTHKCSADPGQAEGFGICTLKNCIDNGGAEIDCAVGQFCAGEPMKDPMTGEEVGNPLPIPDDVPAGVCYDMNAGLWCSTACSSHASCRGGSYPGRHPESPNYCVASPVTGANACHWGCNHKAECPSRWACSSDPLRLRLSLPAAGLKTCTTNTDCGGGSTCVEPIVEGHPFLYWQGTEPFKVCSCKASGTCGAGQACNAGLATVDPENPGAGPVDRYCTVGGSVCGSGGTIEWKGTLSGDPLQAEFVCGCGLGKTCPATGPSGTPLDGQPIRCGLSAMDAGVCVGGSVCVPGPTNNGCQ